MSLLFSCNDTHKQNGTKPTQQKIPQEIVEWFEAWQLVSAELDLQDSINPVDFIFFDDSLVYTTSTTSTSKSKAIDGPSLAGRKTKWLVQPHFNQIFLPDGQILQPGIYSFAAPGKNGKPFFVMPLLSYWKQKGVESNELGLNKLVTGIFLHEFSHSQQMKGLGKLANELEAQHSYDVEFTDNIIQDYFVDDSAYKKLFSEEITLFYKAFEEGTAQQFLQQKDSALRILQKRHDRYLKEKGAHFIQLDNLFLTMEGLGQYLMYKWLVHPEGGGIDNRTALAGVRRGGKNWSQEEGLALFLCMERMKQSNDWIKHFFDRSNQYITSLFATQNK
ncbi:MAG: hypothetical protein JST34_13730 [Bacteroidetes bacterium]|nr:hypothetical protein [Bacteroidota bacterium]